MTTTTPSNQFVDSLVDELRASTEDTIGMLDGTLEVDPIFLLNALATAGLATAIDLDESTQLLLARITRAARTDTGRSILAPAFDFADLGDSGSPALTFDPDADEIEQITTLHRLIEHAGLGTFADVPTRKRLDALHDHNAAIVLMTPDRFEALHAPALMLRDILTQDKDHPARRFVDDIATITSPLPPLIDFDRLAELTAAAADGLLADLPWWRRLTDFATESAQAIAAFLDAATRRPTLALCASHGPARIAWPAPRYLAFRDKTLEVALIADTAGVRLEVFPSAPLSHATLLANNVPCPTTVGPLADAFYFALPDEPTTLTLTLADRDVALPWPPPPSASPIPAAPAFDRWRSVSPGAARELLAELAANDPSAARRREAATADLPLRDYSSDPGIAHFPAVPSPSDPTFPGAILTVRVAPVRPHGSRPVTRAELAPALATLAALVGEPTLAPSDIRIWVEDHGLQLSGRSFELAILAALVGRLLDRSPTASIIASGLLDGPTATAPDELPAKQQLIAREAPDLEATLINSATPVTDLLVAWFGDLSGLTRALNHEPAALVRKAIDAWQHGHHTEAHNLATTALAATLTGQDHAEASWIQGSALLHKGDPAALPTLERARSELSTLTSKRGPRAERFRPEEVDAYLGIGLIDALRPAAARDLLTATRARLDAIAESDRDVRWDQVWVETTGSLARAHVMLGELDTAEYLLETSANDAYLPHELARTLGDLGEIQRKRGHLDAAAATNRRAADALAHIPFLDRRATTERFLRLYRSRLDPILAADYRLAHLEWHAWPQPAEALERLLTASPTTIASWLSDHMGGLTSSPPIALIIYRSTLARAILLHGPNEPLVDLLAIVDRELFARDGIDSDALATDVPSIAASSPY